MIIKCVSSTCPAAEDRNADRVLSRPFVVRHAYSVALMTYTYIIYTRVCMCVRVRVCVYLCIKMRIFFFRTHDISAASAMSNVCGAWAAWEFIIFPLFLSLSLSFSVCSGHRLSLPYNIWWAQVFVTWLDDEFFVFSILPKISICSIHSSERHNGKRWTDDDEITLQVGAENYEYSRTIYVIFNNIRSPIDKTIFISKLLYIDGRFAWFVLPVKSAFENTTNTSTRALIIIIIIVRTFTPFFFFFQFNFFFSPDTHPSEPGLRTGFLIIIITREIVRFFLVFSFQYVFRPFAAFPLDRDTRAHTRPYPLAVRH